MCNNTIVLYLFMILKLISFIILPIIILIKRKEKYTKFLIIVDIVFLLFFLICNTFTINSCVYNSTFDGIKRVNNRNSIVLYNEMHPSKTLSSIKPEKIYKTYTGKDLYYYNQNSSYMSNLYYECNGKIVYFNSIGSSITSFSIALSTLYNNEVDPIQIFNYYKSDYNDLCTNEIKLEKVYNSVMKLYGGIVMNEIVSSQIEQSIKDGGLVIARLEANENSKITCNLDYIVIYNVGLDSKYMIADPASLDNSYVCSYSSESYGRVINNDNMNISWSLSDIDKEATNYYLIRKE